VAIKLPGLGEDRNIPLLAVTLVAALSVVLAVVNMVTARSNTQLIGEVRERQQTINQGIQLSPLNVQLSQLIGTLASQSGDIDLRAVLERYGVSFGDGQAPPGDGAGATKP
jgi:hypothetical protein